MVYHLPDLKIKAAVSAIFSVLCLFQPCAVQAVSIGQIDNFDDGSLQGWRMGGNLAGITASHMTNIVDGGPSGHADNFLQIVADGTAFAGGRLTYFNKLQWTGDYLSAGINSIAMDLNHISSSEILNLRLGINGGVSDSLGGVTGGLFATTASKVLVSGSGWVHIVFSLDPNDLTAVSGLSGTTGNDVLATLSNVTELRLLNSVSPDWSGQPVTAILGVDNMSAVPLPTAALLFGTGFAGLYIRQIKVKCD